MLSTKNLRNQAKKYYKRTLAGPGKFGVFILLCILIIFSFESLGLSHRESNLEIRTINKRVTPVKIQEKKVKIVHNAKNNPSTLDNKLKKFNQIDVKRKVFEIEKILYKGALEQQNYEDRLLIEKIESIKNKIEFEMNYQIRRIENKILFYDA